MGKTLVLGTKKGLLVLEEGARGAWRAARPIQHGGVHVSLAFNDPRSGTLWAALDHGHWGGKLSRSKDGGATWSEVPAPKYPEGCLPGPCTKKPAALRYLYGYALGRPQEPGRLYLGTVPGGLFASEDGGASWTFVDALWAHPTRDRWGQGGKDFDEPGLHSILVDPRDPRRIVVGSSSAGVLETRDGGASWTPRNVGLRNNYMPEPAGEVGHDPHLVAACAAEPDVLWQQNHCGVYRSADHGTTWAYTGQAVSGDASGSTSARPVHFGFPIAADPVDPDTAWVLPATSDQQRYALDGALCAARTTDGGKSWTVLREGLPQEQCFDVVYRHGLDQRGDTLAFGTTTGNLFLSEDRGDTWRSLGSHLPPINSVRFV